MNPRTRSIALLAAQVQISRAAMHSTREPGLLAMHRRDFHRLSRWLRNAKGRPS